LLAGAPQCRLRLENGQLGGDWRSMLRHYTELGPRFGERGAAGRGIWPAGLCILGKMER
jgi:hypothetical protein